MNYAHTPIAIGRITSKFGVRGDDFHAGIDIGAPSGTPVYAVAEGVVVPFTSSGYGIYIDLYFDEDWQQAPSQRHMCRYAHLSKHNITQFQRVKAGEIIGYVGSTGNSTGPHLHFELHLPEQGLQPEDNGYQPWRHGCVDPLLYIEFVLNDELINPLSLVEAEEKPHWAEASFNSLLQKGVPISERRFNDPVTRGELFALLDRILK